MEEFNMKIVPISKEHFARTAKLHCEAYSGDFLPLFGTRFLVAFYDVMFTTKAAGGVVGLAGDELVGFCMFTPDLSKLYRTILKKGFFKLSWLAMLRIARNPSLLKMILEAFLYQPRAKVGDVKAEMLPWAVDPKYRGKGVGAVIWDACEREMLKMGIDTYKLTAIVDKEASLKFFNKKGFEYISEFDFHGRKWLLFLARIKDDRPAPPSSETG
jgi:ribosomal protein S18 acetylase RimI-like enzyme